MVKISTLHPYCPNNAIEFTTNPYDVIGKEEEEELKHNNNSLIHLILPNGEGDELYRNALSAYERFKASNIIVREEYPCIFVYRQESAEFNQEGIIMGVALEDYENGNIVKHEYTREKPLKDRTRNIKTTKVAAGLVWSVFRADIEINKLIEQIKKGKPKYDFEKHGYRHILWQETDSININRLANLFENKKIYIADGHHRAASAAEYRKYLLKHGKKTEDTDAPWQYLLSYVASDDQIRILPYNRVVRVLDDDEADFIEKLGDVFEVREVNKAFNPDLKNKLALCLKGKWFELIVKDKTFNSERDSLDVTILQDKVLEPILGISNVRTDENIFFVGGIQDPTTMEKYITDKGNDIFFNLFPVNIRDLESIADSGGVMPPKSTWFDPKLLSGLVLHDLREE